MTGAGRSRDAAGVCQRQKKAHLTEGNSHRLIDMNCFLIIDFT
jgi:hypothetical protein